jgi:hypothetical protein
MLHAGLDLGRNRLDVCLLSGQGELVEEFAAASDHDGVRGLAPRVWEHGEPVRGVIESMTGARFVHDTLEREGWDVLTRGPAGDGVARAAGQLPSSREKPVARASSGINRRATHRAREAPLAPEAALLPRVRRRVRTSREVRGGASSR